MKLRGLGWLGSFAALALAAACSGGGGDSGATLPAGGASGAGKGGSTGGGTGGSTSGGLPGAGTTSGMAAGEAGMAGAPLTGAAPTLISETPADTADNVWLYDPIVLVFSEPLDPTTVNDAAFSLQVAGKEIAKTVTLSKDGTTVTLNVTAAPVSPGTVTIDVLSTILSADQVPFAGQTWSWHLPLWQVLDSAPGAKINATLPAIALDANDQPFVASLESATAPNPLHVSSWDGSAWHNLGSPLNVDASKSASAPSLVVGSDGNPVVAWGELPASGAGSIYVAGWSGKAWAQLGAALGTSASPVELALDSKGNPVAAWLASATELDVKVWSKGAWAALVTPLTLTADTFHGFGFTISGDTPVVAYYDVNQDLAVKSWSGTAWVAAGAVIDRQLTTSTGRPSIAAAADGTLYVGYLDGDAVSNNGYVRTLPPAAIATTRWVAQDAALDIVLDAEVSSVDVRASADGPVATWVEAYAGTTKVYAARLTNAQFQALGPALSASAKPLVPGAALALDSHGNANVVYQEQSRLGLERYNGSPQAPFGLQGRFSTVACAIPDDQTAMPKVDPPQTLTATGCYSSVKNHTVFSGAIPFEINSALWSDGATKHRYIVLPDKTTIGYTATGAWLMPVGTIIIKEFGYLAETTDPTSLFPMETRFLVKRCQEGDCIDPWQGYSYQWNTAGTEATLLTNVASAFVDWPYATNGVAATAPHRHTYPARSECVTCHNSSIGRVLGLQTPQLNRSHDYGQTVDNELRALDHAGLFGTTFPTTKLDQIARLPTPNDPSFPLEQRARGYFHSNCSHCHNPQGACPQIDFRFYGAGLVANGNICNEIPPGNAGSTFKNIYVRDSTRDPAGQAIFAGQMPPLATVIPDTRELAITAAWINGTTTCP